MIKAPVKHSRLAKHEEGATNSTHTSRNITQSVSPYLRVLALGDCNTRGSKAAPGDTIPDKFCRCLELAGYPTVSQNLGHEMATSQDGVLLLQQRALAADVALINFGMVDCGATSKHAVPIGEYRASIEQMISLCRRLNPKVWIVLWGSPPIHGDDCRNDDLLRYNAELHDIANAFGGNYLPTKPIVESLTTAEAYSDNVHLNEVATAGIATALAHTYLSQLQRTAA